MLKKLFKQLSPSPESVRAHPSLNWIKHLIDDPNLFHLNRYSVSMAFLVGVFWAFVPIPLQMLGAVLMALWVRCNLPLALALVWITNPLTIAPIYYSTYLLGTWLLDVPPMSFPDGLSISAVKRELQALWKPLVVGSLCAGSFLSLLSYFSIKGLWRLLVIYHWYKRRRNSKRH